MNSFLLFVNLSRFTVFSVITLIVLHHFTLKYLDAVVEVSFTLWFI